MKALFVFAIIVFGLNAHASEKNITVHCSAVFDGDELPTQKQIELHDMIAQEVFRTNRLSYSATYVSEVAPSVSMLELTVKEIETGNTFRASAKWPNRTHNGALTGLETVRMDLPSLTQGQTQLFLCSQTADLRSAM